MSSPEGTAQDSPAQVQARYAQLLQTVRNWASDRGLQQSRCFDERRPPDVKVDTCEGYAIPYETCGLIGCSPHRVLVTAYLIRDAAEVRLDFFEFGRSTTSDAKRDAEESLLPLISKRFGNDAILVRK